ALADSGRFVHNPEHLAELAAGCGLALLAQRDSVIRRERRAPAHGALMIFQKI
ncbi:MAG: hypothetical protein JO021_20510, partial [Alphaproteobacteria bacterium]|nr:hypothetical protein [Alphaproteobacteria bacterium]